MGVCKLFKFSSKKSNTKENVDTTNRIINENSDFSILEAYKTARTNIMFSLPKKEGGKVISITSSVPGEGKTTTCINLAITFAQTGAKVLLIDCDLRKARIHRYLGQTRNTGVSNILCGFAEASKSVIKNVRDNLDILTAGEIPPNPAELLQSQGFADLIDEFKSEYDYIFIDTPPVTVVTDSLIVAKQCMGTVVVVRENSTTFDMLDDTMGQFKKTDASILGVIFLDSHLGEKGGKYSNGKYKYKYSYKYMDEVESK